MEPNEKEFARVVREQKSTIYTVCYMFSKDNDEVNDLFQEILINLWKGFDSFEGRSDIRTWVYRVALNTCITIDRKKKRRRDKEAKVEMDINLYEDNDADTKQVKKLYERIKIESGNCGKAGKDVFKVELPPYSLRVIEL